MNEPRDNVASLTTRFRIDCDILEQPSDEVIDFGSSRNMTLTGSRLREQEPSTSSKHEPWFVAERSEALAGVLLTSRKDVRVRDERKQDGGLDFLVEIDAGDPLSTQLFVVQVKGATSSDPNDWMQDVKPLFRGHGSPISLPVCVFVVNVRENNAFYAWLAEPQVEAKGATLRLHETGAFHPLDPAAVSDIIDRVKAWYDVLPSQLMPA